MTCNSWHTHLPESKFHSAQQVCFQINLRGLIRMPQAEECFSGFLLPGLRWLLQLPMAHCSAEFYMCVCAVLKLAPLSYYLLEEEWDLPVQSPQEEKTWEDPKGKKSYSHTQNYPALSVEQDAGGNIYLHSLSQWDQN